MNMYDHEALTMPTRLERMQQAQEMAYETVEPFEARAQQIEGYVGVDLIEPLEVRRDTPLPPGLVLMSASGELQLPEDIATTQEKFVVLTPDGQRKVREAAAEIGIGRAADLTLADIGMPEDAQINLEGGLHTGKFEAELNMAIKHGTGKIVATLTRHRIMKDTEVDVLRGNLARKGDVAVASVATPEDAYKAFALRGEAVYRHIEALHSLGIELPGFAASADRDPLTGNGRAINRTLEYLGVDPANLKTEYDGGVVELMGHPDFIAYDVPIRMGDIDVEGNSTYVANGVVGSLVAIGTIQGRAVYIQEVPRQYLDEAGQSVEGNEVTKKYAQPNAGQLLAGTATLLASESAVVATSSTYFPTRLADVTEAKYNDALDQSQPDRRYGVIAYCPASLAEVQHKAVPEQLGMGHLLAEVWWTIRKFRDIKTKFQRDLAAAA